MTANITLILSGTDPLTITLTAHRQHRWIPGLPAAIVYQAEVVTAVPALSPPARPATVPGRCESTNPPAAIVEWVPPVPEGKWDPPNLDRPTPYHSRTAAAAVLRLSADITVPLRHCPACGKPVHCWRTWQPRSQRGQLVLTPDHAAAGEAEVWPHANWEFHRARGWEDPRVCPGCWRLPAEPHPSAPNLRTMRASPCAESNPPDAPASTHFHTNHTPPQP
jgi:hypothetical protein